MLPVETCGWEHAIKMVYSDAAQVVHEYDDWEVHSPSVTIKVPSVIMVRDYVHYDRSVPWTDEYLVLRDRFRCQYCNKKFPAHKLTQDHVIPRKYGGGTGWDNIVSACAPCNHSRGHNQKIKPRIQPYKPTYWELVEKAKEELQLVIPDENWLNYLDWPEHNIFVKGKAQKILQLRDVA